jgi:hypothetical protein
MPAGTTLSTTALDGAPPPPKKKTLSSITSTTKKLASITSIVKNYKDQAFYYNSPNAIIIQFPFYIERDELVKLAHNLLHYPIKENIHDFLT